MSIHDDYRCLGLSLIVVWLAAHREQAAELQGKVRAVDVAMGELGNDGVKRRAELAAALEILPANSRFLSLSSPSPVLIAISTVSPTASTEISGSSVL